jgi:pimeloyl-ACP methyl ester carboxylesterase
MDKVTSSDRTSIAFERAGTGPALILVDGAMCYRGFGPMAPLAALLIPDFTVFSYDRRGRGDSTDTLPYAVDREIDDLQALIDVAGGSAFVYGVSSGAMLALCAAERGLAIPKLALFEPPLTADGQPLSQPDLAAELATLVAAGRRGDAVEHFQTAVGIPAEMVAGMRHAPFRPALEAIAHTLVYDTTITASLPTARLAAIATPTLVIDSANSPDGLRSSARAAAEALPGARQHSMKGEFHDVPAEDLAPVLTDFFAGR